MTLITQRYENRTDFNPVQCILYDFLQSGFEWFFLFLRWTFFSVDSNVVTTFLNLSLQGKFNLFQLHPIRFNIRKGTRVWYSQVMNNKRFA